MYYTPNINILRFYFKYCFAIKCSVLYNYKISCNSENQIFLIDVEFIM